MDSRPVSRGLFFHFLMKLQTQPTLATMSDASISWNVLGVLTCALNNRPRDSSNVATSGCSGPRAFSYTACDRS